MADGFSLRVVTEGLEKEFARIDKATDRATMWTVRQAGRKVGQYARKAAPVYRGPERERYFQGKKIGPVERGDLKKSIRSSKGLKRFGAGYALTVGPRGVANIYAAKQERRSPFMAPAKSRVVSEIESIGAAAWGRAIRRR